MSITIKYFLVLFTIVFMSVGLCQEKDYLLAPNFKGNTADGKEIKLSDYAGKVVLIDFWASWCPPCREEMPELIKFYNAHGDSLFELIAINIDKEPANMKAFVDKLFPKPGFPILSDTDQQIPALFNIQSMPTTIFLDKKGNIRYRHDGFKLSYINDFSEELTTLRKEK